jgi:hypothetical protein
MLLNLLLPALLAHAEDSLKPLSPDALFAPALSVAPAAPSAARAPAAPVVHKKWVIDVKPGPGVDGTSLKDTVRSASPGDEIEIRPGRYRDAVIVDKDLVIRGVPSAEGRNAVTIFSGDSNIFNFIGGKSRLENINLEQLQIAKTSQDNIVGVYAQKGELSLSNISITTKSSPALAIDGADVKADHLRVTGLTGLQMLSGKLLCEFCEASGAAQAGWYFNGVDAATTAMLGPDGKVIPMATFKQVKSTGNGANGLEVTGNAVVEVEDGMFTGNQANGVQAAGNARVRCTRCQASNNLLSGMLAVGMSQIDAVSSRANSNLQAGFAAAETGRVTAKDSDASANQQVGAATNGSGQVLFDNTTAEGNKVAARSGADTFNNSNLGNEQRAPASANTVSLPGAKP